MLLPIISEVAILNGEFYWREMFRGILPDNADGVVVVTESACGEFRIAVISMYCWYGSGERILGSSHIRHIMPWQLHPLHTC